jgi:hypothetical protein
MALFGTALNNWLLSSYFLASGWELLYQQRDQQRVKEKRNRILDKQDNGKGC